MQGYTLLLSSKTSIETPDKTATLNTAITLLFQVAAAV